MNPKAIDNEVLNFMKDTEEFIFPDIKITLSNTEEDIIIEHLVSYRVNRKFNTNISDVVFLEFTYPLGSFIKKFYDKRDKLEVTIIIKTKTKTLTKRYKAIVLNKLFGDYNSTLSNIKSDTLDEQSLETFHLQCVDPLTLALKNVTTSGIYHDIKLTKLLKTLIGKTLNEVTVLGKTIDYYLNIYKLDNDKVYDNILIKPFTKVIKLPYVFQNYDYGLYNNDVGVYFTNVNLLNNKIVYDINIYPLFDYERYDKELKLPKLLIINPSTHNLDKNTLNATFHIDTYKLLVNNIKFTDKLNDDRFNVGTGYIEPLANMHLNDNLITVTDDKVIMDETLTYAIENTDTGISDYSKLIDTDFDANLYKFKSLLNKNLGIIATVQITNTKAEFIYPGMPVQYMFYKDGEVTVTNGIVQAVDINYNYIQKVNVVTILLILKRLNND